MKYVPQILSGASIHLDNRSRIFVSPERILFERGCTNSVHLLSDCAVQIPLKLPHDICTIHPEGSVLIDFGRELHGYLKLFVGNVTSKSHFTDIRIRFGESADEAMADIGEKGATNDHNPRDIISRVSSLYMPEYGPTGFRFARIDNLSDNDDITLCGVKAISVLRDIEYTGSFECSDPLLNRIFSVGAYTLHLCMQEYIWDGIKRDRLVWVGDMYPEIAALCSVFGYDESVESTLEFAKTTYPLPEFMNGIVTYSAWWIMIQHRWYMQNGRKEYLLKQKDYLLGLVKLLGRLVGEDGTLCDKKDMWWFFDWPSNNDSKLQKSGVHSVMVCAFGCAEYLLRELDEHVCAEYCKQKSALMKNADIPDFGYKQISAMHVFSGMRQADSECERILSHGGAKGVSSFLGLFTLSALSLGGKTEYALGVMRDFYGKMIDCGATSFWEDFSVDWCDGAGRIDELTPDGLQSLHGDRGNYCYKGFRHSLCHGWSSGVCEYMSRFLLGINIIEPGCRKILIKPHLGDLSYIKGTYPTPYGKITLSHTKLDDGTVRTEYTAPIQVEVITQK